MMVRLLLLSCAVFLLTACQNDGEAQPAPKFSGTMVLAMSWQPAFCETRPRVRECRNQRAGRFDTNHFALHGLWPQPRAEVYCGVSDAERQRDERRRWRDLEGLGLTKDIQQVLARVMPGTQSYLHRHEWVKHGTCYSTDPNVYYEDSLALMAAVNASPVRDLFARSIGRRITANQIRRAFDEAFGDGTGDRVAVSCKRDGRRQIITELTLILKGPLTDAVDIGTMARAAPRRRARCPGGEVDRVGLQ
ncbi:MAG: ribonuclease T [Pseudomonadota bacterium]